MITLMICTFAVSVIVLASCQLLMVKQVKLLADEIQKLEDEKNAE